MIFEKWKEERIFLFIMVTVGFLILFITPPMSTPDENTHFANAVSIGYGNVFPELREGEVGRYLSEEINQFIEYNINKYTGNLDVKYSFGENYFDSWLPKGEDKLVFRNMGWSMVSINPIGYLVAALGIRVGSLLCGVIGNEYAKAYNLLIFGRLFNAIFYIVVGFWAIKITPILKRTMMVLLLMPMSIFLGVSISYDAILISICALFFANTFKLIFDNNEKDITIKDIIITIVCTFFMIGIKSAVYAPFLLLLFFIPKEKFKTKKNYIYCIAATMLVAFCAYAGYKLMLNIILGGYQVIEDPLITEQKKFFFSHIYMIPEIAIQTIRNFALFYIQGFYGKLGQIDTNFILPFAVAFYILLLFILFVDIFGTKTKFNWKLRMLNMVLSIVSLGGIFLAMYLTWTPLVLEVGGNVVSGVQGRYFIPAFMFICSSMANGLLLKYTKLHMGLKKLSILFSEILVINSAVWTTAILFLRYWC